MFVIKLLNAFHELLISFLAVQRSRAMCFRLTFNIYKMDTLSIVFNIYTIFTLGLGALFPLFSCNCQEKRRCFLQHVREHT